MDYRIDEIDRRILYYLVVNARDVSAPMIADEVDVSPGTIRNRIRNLEDHGIIRGYHADIDYAKVEGRLTNVFMGTAPVAEQTQITELALDVAGVVEVTELMSGRENLLIVAVGTDTQDIHRIAQELTEIGIEIEDEALVERRHQHPYHSFGPDETQPSTSVTDFRRLAGDAEVIDVTVSEESDVANQSLEELGNRGLISDNILVLAIERGDKTITPVGDTVIKPGDIVTLFSRQGISEESTAAFTADQTQLEA